MPGERKTTEQLTAELAEARRLAESYRSILNSQVEMICRFTPDGTIIFANDSFARLYGKREGAQLLGEKLEQHIPSQQLSKLNKLLTDLSPPAAFRQARAQGDIARWRGPLAAVDQ